MTLSNAYLFELMTAGSNPSPGAVAAATAFAKWAIFALPVAAVIAWVGGTRRLRIDLGLVVATAFVAVLLVWLYQIVGCYGEATVNDIDDFLECWNEDGAINLQVAVWWSVAFALLACGRLAWLGFPVLTLGLAVGWSIVYIGNDFPLDVLRALPVAAIAALCVGALRGVVKRALGHVVDRLTPGRRPA